MAKHEIAIFCHNLEVNGANFFVLTLATALQKQAQITILSPKEGAMSQRFKNIGIEPIKIEGDYSFENISQFDVVFVNSLMMSRVVLECIEHNVPHILIVHETWLPEKINFYLKELWNVNDVTSADILQALERSQKVIFPAKYLERVYESLVDTSRRDTIYCTIEMEMIDKYCAEHTRDEVRKELGITKDEIVFLQVGTVTKRKAQMKTLHAFNTVYNKFKRTKNISLKFVGARFFRPGESEYIDEIKRDISSFGLGNVVEICSVNDNIYKYFIAADVLIHPSINEVLPLAILEACYFELAVIVSNLDGMPEVIRHGVDGLLVNPYDLNTIVDGMVELVNKPGVRRKLGKNARQRVIKQHAISGFEKNYSDLVGKLLNNGSG